MKIFFVITCCTEAYKNYTILRNSNDQSIHIINLTDNLFDDIKYYNMVSRFSCQDDTAGFQLKSNKKDRTSYKIGFIEYITRSYLSDVIMARTKRLENQETTERTSLATIKPTQILLRNYVKFLVLFEKDKISTKRTLRE